MQKVFLFSCFFFLDVNNTKQQQYNLSFDFCYNSVYTAHAKKEKMNKKEVIKTPKEAKSETEKNC